VASVYSHVIRPASRSVAPSVNSSVIFLFFSRGVVILCLARLLCLCLCVLLSGVYYCCWRGCVRACNSSRAPILGSKYACVKFSFFFGLVC